MTQKSISAELSMLELVQRLALLPTLQQAVNGGPGLDPEHMAEAFNEVVIEARRLVQDIPVFTPLGKNCVGVDVAKISYPGRSEKKAAKESVNDGK